MFTQKNEITSKSSNWINIYLQHMTTAQNMLDNASFDKAITASCEAIKISPQFVPAFFVRATIYEKMKEPILAINDCDQIINLVAALDSSQFKTAMLYRVYKLRSYINLKHNPNEYTNDLASTRKYSQTCHLDSQRFVVNFKSMLQQGFSKRLHLLGEKEVLEFNEIAIEYAYIGDTALISANFDYALYYLTLAINLCPYDYVSMNHRGQAHFNNKSYQAALADFNQALEASPHNPHSYYLLAHLQIAIKNTAEARKQFINSFKRFAEEDTELTKSTWQNKIISIISSNIVLEPVAPHVLEKLINPLDYVKKAKTYIIKGKYSQAIKIIHHGLTKFPACAGLYAERGLCYSYLKKPDIVLEDFCIALWLAKINKDSDLPDCYRLLRNYYVEKGEITSAIMTNSFLSRALPSNKIDNTKIELASAIAEKARRYISIENFEQAMTYLNAAIKFDPKNTKYYLDRAIVARELNKPELVLTDLNQAKNYEPKNPRIKTLFKYLKRIDSIDKSESKEPFTPITPIENHALKKKLKLKPIPKKITAFSPQPHKSIPNTQLLKTINQEDNNPDTKRGLEDLLKEHQLAKLARDAHQRQKAKSKAKTKSEKLRQRRNSNKQKLEIDNEASSDSSSSSDNETSQELSIATNPFTLWSQPSITSITLSELELQYFSQLKNIASRTRIVGGAVRDRLLGISELIDDFDFITNATGETEILETFKHQDIYLSEHIPGLFKIIGDGYTIDIFINPDPGSENDASARDFTINTLTMDETGVVNDVLKRGLKDLNAKILDTVIDPVDSFTNDPIRILRAIYLMTKCNLTLADRLIPAIKATKHLLLEKVQPGELNYWIRKLFSKGHADVNFKRLIEYELFDALFPELTLAIKQDFNWHLAILTQTNQQKRISLPFIYAHFVISATASQLESIKETTIRSIIDRYSLFNESLIGNESLSSLLRGAISRRALFYSNQNNTIQTENEECKHAFNYSHS